MKSAPQKPIVVMTGVSRGIGAALAKIAESRFDVLRIERSAPVLSSAQSPAPESDTADSPAPALDSGTLAPSNIWTVPWDLSTPLSLSVLKALEEKICVRKVFALVHCAGLVGPLGSADLHPGAGHRERLLVFDKRRAEAWAVNFHSLQALVDIVLPHLARDPLLGSPRLVHLSSGAAKRNYTGMETYCLSKAAALQYFHQVSLAYGAEKLLALSVAPGTVRTDMMAEVLGVDSQRFRDFAKFQELDRAGDLATPESAAWKVFNTVFEKGSDALKEWHGAYLDVRTLANE